VAPEITHSRSTTSRDDRAGDGDEPGLHAQLKIARTRPSVPVHSSWYEPGNELDCSLRIFLHDPMTGRRNDISPHIIGREPQFIGHPGAERLLRANCEDWHGELPAGGQ